MKSVWMLSWGAGLAGSGVALGAFGAHGLRQWGEPTALSIWETAVRYQLYHGLALLILFVLVQQWQNRLLPWAAGLMIAGSLGFSGSLYLLVVTGSKWWGPVTPLGGSLLLLGWSRLLAAGLWRNRRS